MSMLATFMASANSLITSGTAAACSGGACGNASLNGIFGTVANTLIFLVGAVSVIMIIVGGLRYATSNGDAKQTEAAKNTILYAVVGVVVAIASYAVVNFVVTNIK